MISFLQLRYFLVIANYQNLSRASQELMVAQPALSKVISSLEEELGTPLFKREGKKLILNNAGQEFQHSAQMMVSLLDDNLNNLRYRHEVSGTLNIVLHISCSELFEDIAVFSSVYPDVQIKLYGPEKLRGNPLNSNFNLMVLPDYEFQSLPHIICGKRQMLYALLPDKHDLASRESITLTDLKDEYFAFLSPRDGRLDQSHTLCIEAGFTPKIRYVCHDILFLMQIIAANGAVSLVPDTVVKIYKGMKGIAIIPVGGSYRMSREIGLCLSNKTPEPLEGIFWNFIKDRHPSTGTEDT